MATGNASGVTASRPAIGIITPSANVVVERTAIRLMRSFPDVDIHVSRVPVSGSADPFPDGYDVAAFESAARLLADAEPGVLVWAGSKGVLVGIEKDEALRSRLTAITGLPFTSSALAFAELTRLNRLERIALVTPYTASYQQRLIDGFLRLGAECVAETHGGIADNLAYARIGPDEIAGMARSVVAAQPQAILAWCTNFGAGEVAVAIERETGTPFYDATLLALWDCLRILGIDRTPAAASWGSLFIL
jgi:maleate isomerase